MVSGGQSEWAVHSSSGVKMGRKFKAEVVEKWEVAVKVGRQFTVDIIYTQMYSWFC